MSTNYNIDDPPVDVNDLPPMDIKDLFKNIPLDDGKEVDLGDKSSLSLGDNARLERKLERKLETYGTPVVPCIPTPPTSTEHPPPPPPPHRTKHAIAEKTVFFTLAGTTALEALCSIAPMEAHGNYIYEPTCTFRGVRYRCQSNAILAFTFILLAIMNGLVLQFNPMKRKWQKGQTSRVPWAKYTVICAALSVAILHRAGEREHGMLLCTGVLIAMVYSVPATSKTLTGMILPLLSFMFFLGYTIFTKVWVVNDGNRKLDLYECIVDSTLGFSLPALCMAVPFIILSTEHLGTVRNPVAREVTYIAVEVALALSLFVMVLLPQWHT